MNPQKSITTALASILFFACFNLSVFAQEYPKNQWLYECYSFYRFSIQHQDEYQNPMDLKGGLTSMGLTYNRNYHQNFGVAVKSHLLLGSTNYKLDGHRKRFGWGYQFFAGPTARVQKKDFGALFHAMAGVRYLHIREVKRTSDSGGNSGGVVFYNPNPNNIAGTALANYTQYGQYGNVSSSGRIADVPEYSRMAPALNIGASFGYYMFWMNVEYIPVFDSGLRHEFKVGLSFLIGA